MAVGVFRSVGRIGIGRSRTISTSNTMKIMANRKNRIENGMRAVFLGSNPHSKAEDFSRSECERIFKNSLRANVKIATVVAMIVNRRGRIIIWKLKIFF